MKNLISILVLLLFCVGYQVKGQQPTAGTYMGKWDTTHSELSTPDANTILINPCADYDSQLSTDLRTFEFKKIAGTDKFGWNGGSDVILDYDSKEGIITFKNPVNMNEQFIFELVHPKGSLPKAGVKTYFDETKGGYSAARILITDESEIKNGKCFLHAVPSDKLNSYITGSYTGTLERSLKGQFNSDHSGSFLGVPMTWALASDYQGNPIIGQSTGAAFVVNIFMEYPGKIPHNIDPPLKGNKVASLYRFVNFGDGNVEIYQMGKN